MEFMLSRN